MSIDSYIFSITTDWMFRHTMRRSCLEDVTLLTCALNRTCKWFIYGYIRYSVDFYFCFHTLQTYKQFFFGGEKFIFGKIVEISGSIYCNIISSITNSYCHLMRNNILKNFPIIEKPHVLTDAVFRFCFHIISGLGVGGADHEPLSITLLLLFAIS